MGSEHVVKRCSDCQRVKPVGDFYVSTGARGRDAYCKECRRERDRVRASKRSSLYYETKKKDPLHYRRKKLVKLYGITNEQYMEMHAAQGGVCAICRLPEKRILYDNVSALVVDHCHATGLVRQLLCFQCNVKVGLCEDEQMMLLCRDYLRRHGVEFVKDGGGNFEYARQTRQGVIEQRAVPDA